MWRKRKWICIEKKEREKLTEIVLAVENYLTR